MQIQKLKRAFRSEKFGKVRKVVVGIVGTVVVIVGVVLLFFPGPALAVIPAGFGILALEFGWAKSVMKKVMAGVKFLSSPKNVKRILYENSLSLVLFLLFLLCLTGQMLAGHRDYNQEKQNHGEQVLPLLRYLVSGHAIEATFENWESEFLQMGALVLLTVYLRQKGASDSQPLISRRSGSASNSARKSNAPWPVRKGGWLLQAYKHSLSLSLLILFLLSFGLHAAGGRHVFNEEQIRNGEQAVSVWRYVGSSRFWFESFQNWQSEFLSVGVLLVLSIFLREKGSPQSKPINAPHSETGSQEPSMVATSLRS